MQLEPPTLSLGVPTIWLTLIQTFDAAQAPGSPNHGRWKLPRGMRSLVGGAAVPEALIRAFDRHGIWIEQGWGMTETSPVCTISYPRAELQGASEDEKFRRAAMAGVPVPWWTCAWWATRACSPGTAAAWARSRYAAPSSPAGTTRCRATRASSPTTAGCAPATWRAWTDSASCASRTAPRTLIKSGGEWISSVDLENALMAHPAVAEAAVIAIPHEKWGERPLACVVLKKGVDAHPGALNEHLQQHAFAKWQLPNATNSSKPSRALPPASSGSCG
jgi:fatty-acyl-CoA synthase